MSLLTICQDAADECGFESPSSIINNNDPIAKKLLRFCNKEGKKLSRFDWQILIKEGLITLVTSDQDYSLASDFSYILPSSTWNRDNKRQVVNPVTSQQWQFLKSWTTIQGLNLRARIRNNEMEFEQEITSSNNGKTIAYEYVSNYWVISQGTGTADQKKFLMDSDTSVIDEELITLGVIWRFKKSHGLDWKIDFQEYEIEKRRIEAYDKGARVINLSKSPFNAMLGVNIPDRDYTL